MNTPANRRILLIDDMGSIHADFRKILAPAAPDNGALDEAESALFGDEVAAAADATFELDSAYQGQEGLARLIEAKRAGRPYAMAFVDMRMPPGWNGVETIEHLWRADPELQVVICTAYSDETWDSVLARLDARDRLLILKKPFEAVEVHQLARALTAKWQMSQDAAQRLARLEEAVQQRTQELRAANEALQQDIVLRMRNEAELKLAASVFHNTVDGVMITDAQGRVLSVNPAFAGLAGVPAEALIDSPAQRLHSQLQGPDFFRSQQETLQREGRWQGEQWNQRGDGENFLAWLTIVTVPGTDGLHPRHVNVFHDLTTLRRNEEKIRHLAFHDALTGLPNRLLFLERLEQAITMAQRDGDDLGLMFIDLDRFKAVNDSYGHDIGDELLKALAERMLGCVRASDTVARLGGDEFVILLRRVGEPQHHAQMAQKLIDSLSAPARLGGHSMQVGASIGIACHPRDGDGAQTLLMHADAAMYAAKSAGRGTYRYFQPEMTTSAIERLQLEMELRRAVPAGELVLFYQPKVRLADGGACGVEALVRWRHPVRGLLAPADFIPIAESTNLICELGDWVLREACRQSRQWYEQGLGRVRIAVNVSARQLQQADLVERIDGLTRRYGMSPTDLEIELTEDALMADMAQCTECLQRLRRLGVRVAIDDFGTGYSSLARLRLLPIDIIKIDHSFISQVDHDEADVQVVKMILAVAGLLRLGVVAEGVETEAQAAALRGYGCVSAQGYLYARPGPAAQISDWLRQHATDADAGRRTAIVAPEACPT
jgi:diguanylate cyclase (GGDEF)-like protein/PAS domain S-box-containing protein